MPVRTKTRRRLWTLLIICLAGSLLLGGGYVLRKRQIAARLLRDRDEGYAALEKGDYYTALHKIGSYVQRNDRDPQALLKYAIARANVEEPNGKHLQDAISRLRYVLEIQPQNAEARKQLLDIYLSVGWMTEILTATTDRTDTDSLRARAIALAASGSDSESLTLSKKYNAALPTDLEMQMFTLQQMKRTKASEKEIQEAAAALQQSKPDDPRFELLVGFAYALNGKPDDARDWTRRAAAQTIEDPTIVHMAVNQLDQLGELNESFALLQRAAQVRGDLTFTRDVVARLFDGGQYSGVIERTADLEQQPRADVDLLAFRAMAFIESRRSDDASRVISLLSARTGDVVAAAWAGVLTAANAESIDANAMRQACRTALRTRPNTPYFHLYYGDVLMQLGEGDLAVREWQTALRLSPSAPRPLSRIVNIFIASRQSLNSNDIAQLERLSRDDADSLASLAAAKLIGAGSKLDDRTADQIMTLVDRAQTLRPGEVVTLGVKVRLLAAQGKQEQAKAVIQAALDPAHTAPASGLLQLAAVSEAQHLDLEQQCFERYRAAYGVRLQLAAAMAGRLLRANRAAEAVATVESMLPPAATRDAAWDILYARILEAASDARAAAQWTRVAGVHRENIEAQYALLGSVVAQRDQTRQRQAIDRIKSIMEDEGLVWRLADARLSVAAAQLSTSDEERKKNYVSAAKTLGDITRAYPNHVQAHLLLSQVFMQLGDKDAAADHLATAIRIAPGALAPPLQLASLLEAMGDFNRALPYLDQAEQILGIQSTSATPVPVVPAATQPVAASEVSGRQVANAQAVEEAWRTLAQLRAAAGQTQRAIEILRSHSPAGGAPDLNLASLLVRSGGMTEDFRRQLLTNPTPEAVGIVAEYLLNTGQSAEAESTIAMLDKLDAPLADKELARAMYLGRKGDVEQSIQHLRAACTAAPANSRTWEMLVNGLIIQGNADQAIAAATEAASKAAPDSRSGFQRIVNNEKLVRNVMAREAARPALTQLTRDSEQSDSIITALTALQGELNGSLKPEQALAAAKAAADQAQSNWALQLLVIDMYTRGGDSDGALGLAARAMRLRPTDPGPAQVATQITVARGRWQEVIGLAQDWQKRSGMNALAPDQVLAQAYLANGNAASAEKLLVPYMQRAKQDPARWSTVLILSAQAAFAQGRVPDAEALLDLGLGINSTFRAAARQLAFQQPDPAVTRRWLTKVERATPADAQDERVALAAAWVTLAKTSTDDAVKQDASRSVADAAAILTSSKQSSAASWAALGSVKESAADKEGAVEAYRAALKADPNEPIAQNNLAMMLIRRGADGDVAEAVKLATAAASQESHPLQADFLDTLALVQQKAGDFDKAIDAINKAVKKRPTDPTLQCDQVEILLGGKKIPAARDAMNQLNLLMRTIPKPDAELAKRVRSLNEQILKLASSN